MKRIHRYALMIISAFISLTMMFSCTAYAVTNEKSFSLSQSFTRNELYELIKLYVQHGEEHYNSCSCDEKLWGDYKSAYEKLLEILQTPDSYTDPEMLDAYESFVTLYGQVVSSANPLYSKEEILVLIKQATDDYKRASLYSELFKSYEDWSVFYTLYTKALEMHKNQASYELSELIDIYESLTEAYDKLELESECGLTVSEIKAMIAQSLESFSEINNNPSWYINLSQWQMFSNSFASLMSMYNDDKSYTADEIYIAYIETTELSKSLQINPETYYTKQELMESVNNYIDWYKKAYESPLEYSKETYDAFADVYELLLKIQESPESYTNTQIHDCMDDFFFAVIGLKREMTAEELIKFAEDILEEVRGCENYEKVSAYKSLNALAQQILKDVENNNISSDEYSNLYYSLFICYTQFYAQLDKYNASITSTDNSNVEIDTEKGDSDTEFIPNDTDSSINDTEQKPVDTDTSPNTEVKPVDTDTSSNTEAKPVDTDTSSDSDKIIITDSDNEKTPTPIYGDVDLDGEVSMRDVVLMQKHIVALISLSKEQLARADVTSLYGELNMMDVTYVQKYLAHLIREFPADVSD